MDIVCFVDGFSWPMCLASPEIGRSCAGLGSPWVVLTMGSSNNGPCWVAHCLGWAGHSLLWPQAFLVIAWAGNGMVWSWLAMGWAAPGLAMG